MVIVPSLDVRGGRLANAPAPTVVERARQLVRDGATELHLVDLDGAETGVFANLEVLSEAARAAAVPCRLAGGMCEVSRAREALERGFAGVLFSSAVFGDDDLLPAITSLGERAIVEIEARDGFLAPRGGGRTLVEVATGRGVLASARAARQAGVRALYVIDVGREGGMSGPPIALVEAVRAVVGDDVVLHTGGGVRDLDDVRALAAHGVASVVVGRALSEARFTLREAQRAIVQA